MLKKTILLSILFSTAAQAKFIHPMDFDGSDAQKQEVIEYIKDNVKKDYCEQIDMCQPSNLRMMEQENLDAFKKATKATNRKIMDQVIKDYCNSGIDMCSYSTILMMYEENNKADKEELSW
ncbi:MULTISPECIES: hypothetical protein [unclassified Gilliamella]|uniref:hypothetical protein n=1 Tax=unclassified Gilliamella TaxID=2685620 RepID=UPI002269F13B|nr:MULTISPECIES: hypothetical protein [unclassified Gilliamella]MCX8582583.1 hypothetical protein [Gilliamella sp. B3372]MCX8594334.1 hypothetical protein [Gilliamella sp. B3367]